MAEEKVFNWNGLSSDLIGMPVSGKSIIEYLLNDDFGVHDFDPGYGGAICLCLSHQTLQPALMQIDERIAALELKNEQLKQSLVALANLHDEDGEIAEFVENVLEKVGE